MFYMYEPCKKCCDNGSGNSTGIFVFIAFISFICGLAAGIFTASRFLKNQCEDCCENDEDFDSAEYVRSLHLDDDDDEE